jgi:DNA-binding LytR/AlgR family response regulator
MSMSGKPASAPALPKARRGRLLRFGDIWQWLGLSGDAVGTGGILRRTFFYAGSVGVTIAGGICLLNVLTILHDQPHQGLLEPLILEGSSWVTLAVFIVIPWAAYRLAPLHARPRIRLLVHIPAALLFSVMHVAGFIALRKMAYRLAGGDYHFGSLLAQFPYELGKDLLAYVLFVGGFALVEHLLRQQQLVETPGQTLTFDIRDGNRLLRVRLSEILAVSSAGNYVEFILHGGRRLLMRSPLSAVESDLSNRGFVRTHRSWLVNETHLTELVPEGSGDYSVKLGNLGVPLSRRFPDALTRLRSGPISGNPPDRPSTPPRP